MSKFLKTSGSADEGDVVDKATAAVAKIDALGKKQRSKKAKAQSRRREKGSKRNRDSEKRRATQAEKRSVQLLNRK